MCTGAKGAERTGERGKDTSERYWVAILDVSALQSNLPWSWTPFSLLLDDLSPPLFFCLIFVSSSPYAGHLQIRKTDAQHIAFLASNGWPLQH